MNIINKNSKITNGYYYAQAGAGVLTAELKTLCDNIQLFAVGAVRLGSMRLSLIGINSRGKGEVYKAWELGAGDFDITFSFDPINLAVYRDMQAFYIELLATSQEAEFSVERLELSESEIALSFDNREQTAKRVRPVPNKMLFIGNSLVFGMGGRYGMCSTSPERDYFHHVSEYVKSKNPDCKFLKLYGSSYEHCESVDAYISWMEKDANSHTGKPACESFTEDMDIIFIQLGDNINTMEKNDTFKITGDMLIESIKKRSPNADIIWINGWYNREPTFSLIDSLTKRYGIQRIDIRDLRCPENENHTDETYLDKNGDQIPIRDTWRTHPGNLGVKAIADRIIENLGF